jgi:hydroxypyruvate reductase
VESARKDLIKPKQFMNKVLSRNSKLGRYACEIMAAAINAVDPYQIITQYVSMSEGYLNIGDDAIPLSEVDRIFLIGFGKASALMAKALLDILPVDVEIAEIVTKNEKFQGDTGYKQKLRVHLGGHPMPTEDSVQSTRAILANFESLTLKDLVLIVVSGGGSALFTDPIQGITLDDLRVTTDLLLKSGANIQEINTIRKHLDHVKGGRLAALLQPAQVHAFILSDVIGDPLDMIASGPTVPDPTTFADAVKILVQYDLVNAIPENILNALYRGQVGEIEETLKLLDFEKMSVKNHLIGTNLKAAEAAKEKSETLGFNSLILTSHLVGHTCYVAETLSSIIQTTLDTNHPICKPACLILGGETTVEVRGDGKGGRNQDLVLHMVKKINGKPGVLFISLATDGEDGPTDAAGAASDAKVYCDGLELLGSSIDTYIENNNAYNYFKNLGGLIKIGSTGTNVNDLILILIE